MRRKETSAEEQGQFAFVLKEESPLIPIARPEKERVKAEGNRRSKEARKPAMSQVDGDSRPLSDSFEKFVNRFKDFGTETRVLQTEAEDGRGGSISVPTFVNEFWTSKQRAASSLHEISYRACYKPQLPRFFIEGLTRPGDVVYDPFMGRGTTLIEAALLGRIPYGSDINPLSEILAGARLAIPTLEGVSSALSRVDWTRPGVMPEDLSVFYHPDTLREISALRRYLLEKRGSWDSLDGWLSMVAMNRLTGHSTGFFSVYSLPPNQAVSVKSQRRINEKRNQIPPRRSVPAIILKKSKSLLSDCDDLVRSTVAGVADSARLWTGPAHQAEPLQSESVQLVVTSPPFLAIVQYAIDNWLRCWFMDVDAASVPITMAKNVAAWRQEMEPVFVELLRVLSPGGHIAFEVGEVNEGTVKLEESVIPCGRKAGLDPLMVVINDQEFTKTANCWGVNNNTKGTNTNRIVVFRKP